MAARYLAIAEDLSARISSGEWQLGAFLPSEPDLASAYGVSRETLRGALRQLEESGLIERRKGQGTRVTRLQPAQEFRTKLSSIQELVDYGQSTVRTILSIDEVAVDDRLAEDLDVPKGVMQTCLTFTRQEPGKEDLPLSLAKVYLSPQDASLIWPKIQDSDRLTADLVAEHTGRQVVHVVQRIKAVPLDAEAARVLGELPGSVALQLTRRYLDSANRVLAVAISTHPGSRFVYESALERN